MSDEMDAIEARADAATPAPWEMHDFNEGEWPPRPLWGVANAAYFDPLPDDSVPWLAVEIHTGCEADAEFIAHARTDVPALVARCKAAEAKVAEAWDEGKRAGIEQMRPANPYRALASETSET